MVLNRIIKEVMSCKTFLLLLSYVRSRKTFLNRYFEVDSYYAEEPRYNDRLRHQYEIVSVFNLKKLCRQIIIQFEFVVVIRYKKDCNVVESI